jgi:catechol 2,3-dioxygenase-like lactoylglutathione lyase family enzyme
LSLPVCQIALSVTDLGRAHQWYRQALGFFAAGERRHRDEPIFAEVPGLPEASLDVWCLVERRPLFQLEMIHFERPRMRPIPDDWRPSDVGYSSIGLSVSDFDHALDRLTRTSGRLLTAPCGDRGDRRACLRDPDGILLELIETRSDASGTVATPTSVRLSVSDLDRAARFWVDGLGLEVASGVTLHRPEHEALWGLPGAKNKSLVVSAGDFFVELVRYESPAARARPAGALLSDQGILNIALGSTDVAAVERTLAQVTRAGYRPRRAPWTLPNVATVVYIEDDQGFTVELLHVHESALDRMGFVASTSAGT